LLVYAHRSHYDRSYDDTYTRFASASHEWPLERWEEVVLVRYNIMSGKILVLGTGISGESITLAKRGLRVVGLDISQSVLRIAAQIARTAGLPVAFVQADFLALPTHPANFDYILLPSIMYSSIPSRIWRQTWLRQLTCLLSLTGLAVQQFLADSDPTTRRKRVIETINRWLTRLPGTNRLYQPGDTCLQGHFLHAFQSEQETAPGTVRERCRAARTELAGAIPDRRSLVGRQLQIYEIAADQLAKDFTLLLDDLLSIQAVEEVTR
jgi:hypothetical protein